MLTKTPHANPAEALKPAGCTMRLITLFLKQSYAYFSRKNIAGLIFFGVTFALLVYLRAQSYLEPLTLMTYDAFEKTQRTPGLSPDVIVVGLRDSELGRAGSHPASDALIAQVLDAVQAQGPAAVMISNQRDVPIPPGREQLLASLAKYPNVFVAQIKDRSEWTDAARAFYQAAGDPQHLGFVFKVMDIDERHRNVLTSINSEDEARWVNSMPFLAAQYFLVQTNATPINSDENGILSVGSKRYATPSETYADFGDAVADATTQYIPYSHAGGFLELGWFDILDGKFDPAQLKGKLVVIGDNADLHLTKIKTGFGRHFFDIDDNMQPSTLNAFNADQLIGLSKYGWRPMLDWPDWVEYVWMFVWSIIFAISLHALTSFRQIFLRLAIALMLLVVSCFVLFRIGYWAPFVLPLLMLVLSGAWTLRLGIYHVVLTKRASTLMHWLIDQLPEPVWVLDADGVVRVANEAFCRLAGRLPKEVLHKPLSACAVNLVASAELDANDTSAQRFEFNNSLGEKFTLIAQRDRAIAKEFAGFETFIVRGILTSDSAAIDSTELAAQRLRLERYWAQSKDRMAVVINVAIEAQSEVASAELVNASAERIRKYLSGIKALWQTAELSLALLFDADKNAVQALQNSVILAFEWPLQLSHGEAQVVVRVSLQTA